MRRITRNPLLFCQGGFSEWADYLAHIAECYCGIAVDQRYTLGRYALDFAALERPLICGNTAINRKLFPDLICHYYDLDKQAELLNQIYYDEEFYANCVAKAQIGLQDYTHSACRQLYSEALRRAGYAGEI